jgi:glucosaminylphosphatidylinositol acyltransferase
MSGHQIALTLGGGQSWVMTDRRHGLLGMNKEGIVSFTGEFKKGSISRTAIFPHVPYLPWPGYFAIFLLGLDLGHYLLPPDPYYFQRLRVVKSNTSTSMRIRTRRKAGKLALVLLSYSTVWWVCLTFLRVCGMQVSRRLVSVVFSSS